MPKIAYGAMVELAVSEAVLVREKAPLQHRRTSVPSLLRAERCGQAIFKLPPGQRYTPDMVWSRLLAVSLSL